jgi:hypothetical protein
MAIFRDSEGAERARASTLKEMPMRSRKERWGIGPWGVTVVYEIEIEAKVSWVPTEVRHGFFEIGKVDISCQVTFAWSIEYIDNFVLLESLQ